jgi:hypothetical protein
VSTHKRDALPAGACDCLSGGRGVSTGGAPAPERRQPRAPSMADAVLPVIVLIGLNALIENEGFAFGARRWEMEHGSWATSDARPRSSPIRVSGSRRRRPRSGSKPHRLRDAFARLVESYGPNRRIPFVHAGFVASRRHSLSAVLLLLRPLTPEVAGSSPVAPALSIALSMRDRAIGGCGMVRRPCRTSAANVKVMPRFAPSLRVRASVASPVAPIAT